MTRASCGPRGLRREVHNARSSSPMPHDRHGGVLSECLQNAGADVVSKISMGALQKTDISRAPGLAGELVSAPNESDKLRMELDKTKATLKTLQRHYESMSALLANEREELANFRQAHADHEKECHELRKENDKLSKDLADCQQGQTGAKGDQEAQKKQAGLADKKITELEAVLKDSRAQVQRLQESLRTEKSAAQTSGNQLQEARSALGRSQQDLTTAKETAEMQRKSLKEAEAKVTALEAQCAQYKNGSGEVEERFKVLEKQRENLEAEALEAHAKAKLGEEKLSKQQLEMQGLRAAAKTLGESLAQERAKAEAAKEGQDAAEARARGMLAEAEANALEARKRGQQEVSELKADVAELRKALEAERALLGSVRGELSRDAEAHDIAAAEAAAVAAAALARNEGAEAQSKKLQAELQAQKEENENKKRRELEKLQANMTANQREIAERLQAEREEAIKSLEDQLQIHEENAAKQREELAGKVAGLASERRRLADEVTNLQERERKASTRVGELETHELDLEAAVTKERARADAFEKTLAETAAARLDVERQLHEERAHWADKLQGDSHRAEGLESAAQARLNELTAAKNEAEGALVAARREQDMLRTSLEQSEKAVSELQGCQEERDCLQTALASERESSETLIAERDMLQKAVSNANQRLSATEQDCDGLRAAKDSAALSAEAALQQAATSASAQAAAALEQASASSQAALAAQQEAVRKAEMLRLRAEEVAASRSSAAEELSRRVSEQEKRLADAARAAAELQAAKEELVIARKESAEAKDNAKVWGDRVTKIESEQGSSCARLKRSEANLELLRSELEEAKSENQQLNADLQLTEQRLRNKG